MCPLSQDVDEATVLEADSLLRTQMAGLKVDFVQIASQFDIRHDMATLRSRRK